MPFLYPFTKNAIKYVDVANASRIITSYIYATSKHITPLSASLKK
jgi:hypothetical protein